jgi:hypothetical protein
MAAPKNNGQTSNVGVTTGPAHSIVQVITSHLFLNCPIVGKSASLINRMQEHPELKAIAEMA